MNKRQNLEQTQWMHKQPLIFPAGEAYMLSYVDHRFYMVKWSGDKPAGYSRFKFTGVVSGGYEIHITDEYGDDITALESDEWVLVFQQY